MIAPASSALCTDALQLLGEWTRIHSVAGDTPGLRRMAGTLAAWMRDELGADIVRAGQECTPPIVHARIERGFGHRLILYNMYDVMPAAAAGWSADPFTGGLVDLDGHGSCFVGRGAENSKGPLAGMLVALRALLRSNSVAADVELLIEGEEESGSHALRSYLLDPGSPVQPAGAALFPSFCEYAGGPPRIYLGFKGIVHGSVHARCSEYPIHSSNAPWMRNPAWQLVTGLAALGGEGTGCLDVRPFPPEMRPVLSELAANFDELTELAFRGARSYSISGSTEAKLEHLLTTATLTLASLATEPQGMRAIIPSSASAFFDLRLPPDLDPNDGVRTLRTKLASFGELVKLEIDDTYPAHRFCLESTGVPSLIQTYRQNGLTPQIWPWTPGAAPAYAFSRVAPGLLIGGLGRGGNAHGTDEFVTVSGLQRFIESMLVWIPATAAEIAGGTLAPERQ